MKNRILRKLKKKIKADKLKWYKARVIDAYKFHKANPDHHKLNLTETLKMMSL